MNIKRIIIIAACVLVVLAGVIVYTQVIVPSNKYNNAVKAMQNKQYTEASVAFQELKNYKDSETRLLELHANELFDSRQYADVVEMYATLPTEYQDHANDLIAMYSDASSKRDSGEYDEAIAVFASLGNYTDSVTQIRQTKYLKADSLADADSYDEAISIYTELGDYSDSADKIPETWYRKAEYLAGIGSFDEAISIFEGLGDYPGASDMVLETKYLKAGALAASGEYGDYQEALDLYQSLGEYKDSSSLYFKTIADNWFNAGEVGYAYTIYAELDEKYQTHAADYQAMYEKAVEDRNVGEYDAAIQQFRALGYYSDASEQVLATKYMKAVTLAGKDEYDAAIAVFEELKDYKDSAVLVKKTKADQLYALGDLASAYDIYVMLDKEYQTHADDYQAMYDKAIENRNAGNYDAAILQFRALGKYSDAADQVLETKYSKAVALDEKGEYDTAIAVFEELNDYKDSAVLVEKTRADQLYASGDIAAAYDVYVTLEKEYQTHAADYQTMYDEAVENRNAGKYDKAVLQFRSLGKYSDSEQQIDDTLYLKAESLANAGEYDKAKEIYDQLGDYRDCKVLAQKMTADQLYASGNIAVAYDIYATLEEKYQTHAADYKMAYESALSQQQAGEFDAAYNAFLSLGKYSDSASQAVQTQYLKATALADAGQYDNAIAIFTELGTYADSVEKVKEATYQKADNLYAGGKLDEAKDVFASLGDYSDSAIRNVQVRADALFASGNWADAYDIYAKLGEKYQTHAADYVAAYAEAESKLANKEFDDASELFAKLGNYSDAKERSVNCIYEKADYLQQSGKYVESASVYNSLNEPVKANQALYENAEALRDNKEYIKAAVQFTVIIAYSDSQEQRYQTGLLAWQDGKDEDAIQILSMDMEYSEAIEMIYQIAKKATKEERFDVSTMAYRTVGAYKDAAMCLSKDTYAMGEQLFNNGYYDEAAEVFASMGEFSDAQERVKEARYQAAAVRLSDGEYEEAKAIYSSLKNYNDSTTMIKECDYRPGKAFYEAGEYQKAYDYFIGAYIQNYKDVPDILIDCRYQLGIIDLNNKQYSSAAKWFKAAGDYLDSIEKEKECRYQLAMIMKNEGQYDSAIKALEKLKDYRDSAEQIRSCYKFQGEALEAVKDYEGAYNKYQAAADEKMHEIAYQAGLEKLAKTEYEEAITWFVNADGYGDSKENIYSIGEYSFSTKQYELAEKAFVTIADVEKAAEYLYEIGYYYDQNEKLDDAYRAYHESGEYAFEKVYQEAKNLYNKGEYVKSYNHYLIIVEYKDVKSILANDNNLIVAAEIVACKQVQVDCKHGKQVFFGRYEQDNNIGNGKEEIEWIVLKTWADRALLVSRYALECLPYNNSAEPEDTSWPDCSLRKWLNTTFLNEAFNKEEQKLILETAVDNGINTQIYRFNNPVLDKITLLSYQEAYDYFDVKDNDKTNNEAKVFPTAYVIAKGAYVNNNTSTWWLRTNCFDKSAFCVASTGWLMTFKNANIDAFVVRPALCISLKQD